ncbi:hypothetical protein FIBSPDRAFT_1038542 [Athelia psychrophila]|uniref:Uncharacterized protein n=1 Tax=Athelia psychrophila TaxID=1759441 RepID=A0A166STQ9_9AGAM|nr:hypothetical protein FIBSPDRAFT_1038542 [Fibularhizoctonia sp. CBS 109695]
MTSFNTMNYPTQESHVTNVGGDHLTFHTGDVIIIHYHLHPPAVAPVDRDHTGTTGGDQSGALPHAAQDADIVVQRMPDSVWGRFLSIFGL